MGFFSDAYDLFAIGMLTKLLGRIYYQVFYYMHLTATLAHSHYYHCRSSRGDSRAELAPLAKAVTADTRLLRIRLIVFIFL